MSIEGEFVSDESIRLEECFANLASDNISIEELKAISRKTAVPLRRVECFALDKGLIPLRYQRNIGTVGVSGQIRLLESTVMLVGLGGLGGNILEQIARAGFGTIIVVDPDIFDQSNLNRQLLSSEDTLGKEKIAVAEKRIREINSAVDFTGHVCKFQTLPDNLWKTVDMVFDCLDNIPDRLILADKCRHANCPLVHGAIAGWYAEVGVVWPGSEMLETYYQGQTEGIEKELGTPAPTAAMAASIMVARALQIIAGYQSCKESKMHVFNLMDNEWDVITM